MSLNDEAIDGTERFTAISFGITNTCNKNCKYCLEMYKKNDPVIHTKVKDYKSVVSYISKTDKKRFRIVVITGGEPLLHPRFIEIANLVRKDFPKAEIIVFSNGKLLEKLPQKNLRILPDIKNIIFRISDYKNWNDNIKEIYDNSYKLPNIWQKIVRKLTESNGIVNFISLDFRIPIMRRLRRFLINPLKRGNVYFGKFSGFYNPYDDPKVSKERAKAIRRVCNYNITVIGTKLYNCCHSEIFERCYDIGPVSVEFDENWRRNYFKIPTWKACVHCRQGENRYKFVSVESKFGYKKYEGFDLKTRLEITNIKGHE